MPMSQLPSRLRAGVRASKVLLCSKRLSRSRYQASCKSTQQASRTQSSIGFNDPCLYNYTSGRWLYNDASRLTERYLFFDALELCNVIAKSVERNVDDIQSFAKIAEGESYSVFEATFQNGLKTIARLPYPCTVPRRHGTASEVATMGFLRLHGIPTPKVLDWSNTSANSVGAEFIIMERVSGMEMEGSWYTMSPKRRMAIIEQIVDLERVLFSIEFPANGSLYFDKSLDDGIDRVEIAALPNAKDAPKFCIGPSTEYLWWYQSRDKLNLHGGPWKSTDPLLRAVGEREQAWLKKFGIPKHFQNYGDEDSENFEPPRLPNNFSVMSDAEKDAATEIYRRRQVHYFYVGHTIHLSPLHFRAMATHHLVMRNRLYDAAGRPWEGDSTSLKAELARASKLWYTTTSPSASEPHFPLLYTDVEMEQCLAIDEKQKAADSKMQAIRDFIGINIDGWIPNSLYEEAVAKEKHIKEQIMDSAETEDERKEIEENWPFKDHEELD